MKTQVANHAGRHSPYLELCMDHSFKSSSEIHGSCSEAVGLLEVAKEVKELLLTVTNADEQKRLTGELEEIMTVHSKYVGHVLRTKHQADYYKFILNNLQPGEAVFIVDY